MKKIIATLLIICISQITAFAEISDNASADNAQVASIKRTPLIEDELIKSDEFPKVVPTYVKETEPITDDIVVPQVTNDGQDTIKLWVRKDGVADGPIINDELVTPGLQERVGNTSILRKFKKNNIEDNLAKTNLSAKQFAKIRIKNTYDFTKAQIPVQLKIIKNLTTKNNILEGDKILFKTIKDVSLNGIILPKGTQIIGRVETISASDKMGCPANIVIDNFYVKNNPEICFYGNVTKTGANRSIWVYPLYQAGNLMFYVAGFAFVPIHGGHAKVLTTDTFTVFYETR